MSHMHWLEKIEVETKAECQDIRMTYPEEGRNREAKTTYYYYSKKGHMKKKIQVWKQDE